MKIAETYSHLNGLEYLLVHHKKLWREIQQVVNGVDANLYKTKVSNEVRMKGQLKFNPKELNAAFFKHLKSLEWAESRVSYWVTRDYKLIRKTLHKSPAEQKAEIEAGHL